jgi:carbamoyltransferase
VLAKHADRYFHMNGSSPYMLKAVQTRPEAVEQVAGIVHVDGSARVQTVDEPSNPRYHHLISEFHRRTGVPLVLNTSFNANGEPIVETPDDAIDDLFNMNLDALALDDYLVWREDSPP